LSTLPAYEHSTNSLFDLYAFDYPINCVGGAISDCASDCEHGSFAAGISPWLAQCEERITRATQIGEGRFMASSIQNVSAEQLAKVFHHYHEALAHDFHGQASREVAASWDEAPQDERKLMVAAARLTLLELAAPASEEPPSRRYFAKAGEAEWGC
jgi:hypothetical protein